MQAPTIVGLLGNLSIMSSILPPKAWPLHLFRAGRMLPDALSETRSQMMPETACSAGVLVNRAFFLRVLESAFETSPG